MATARFASLALGDRLLYAPSDDSVALPSPADRVRSIFDRQTDDNP